MIRPVAPVFKVSEKQRGLQGREEAKEKGVGIGLGKMTKKVETLLG